MSVSNNIETEVDWNRTAWNDEIRFIGPIWFLSAPIENENENEDEKKEKSEIEYQKASIDCDQGLKSLMLMPLCSICAVRVQPSVRWT